MIPGQAQQFFEAAAAQASGFEIERSLRFNNVDSAYLSRTFSAGNRKTWTWSSWVKRSRLSANNQPFMYCRTGSDDNTYLDLRFAPSSSPDSISLSGYATNFRITDAVFRDSSAWFHFVAACDTTQSSNSDRVKFYINGVQQTFSTESTISQDADLGFNQAEEHRIGDAFGGYFAEIHFIDGLQLAASDFGETNANGVWQPKEYSGSYGTNGFYLKFDDNSSAAALGTDSSGNNNTWTVNNISGPGGANDYAAALSVPEGGGFNASYPATNAFDGSTSTFALPTNTSTSVRWTYDSGFGLSGAVEIYVTGASMSVTFDDGRTAVTAAADSYTEISSSVDFTWFNVYQGSGLRGNLVAVRVDGNVLINSTGANNDSLIDTPTNYTAGSGNNGGNYCTWNPLSNDGNSTLTNGNLQSQATSVGGNTFGTIKMPNSGKYYWECEITALSTSAVAGFGLTLPYYNGNYIVSVVGIWYVASTGNISYNSTQVSYGDTFGLNDIIGVAVDCDDNTIEFFKNGVSQGEADPSSYSLNVTDYVPGAGDSSGAHNNTIVGNFGQRAFVYTPPTGHVSLCTQNLPSPTVADGSSAMSATLYSGDGTNDRAITTGHSSDLVWIKARNQTDGHNLFDILRGVTNVIKSNSTAAEITESNSLTAFDSNGFTVGDNASNAQVNQSGFNYVAWSWNGGTSTESNTDGTITTSVRANTSAGFSIVSYTGNGTIGATIGHGLGATPEFLIFKNRDDVLNWYCYHVENGATKVQYLNATIAATTNDFLNDTAPTSSVITLKNTAEVNANTQNIICYAWTSVSGYSDFGSFVGTGSSSTAPFVYTGFRPALIIFKASSTTSPWNIFDTARDPYNVVETGLLADSANAEFSGTDRCDILSNGFRVRAGSSVPNVSGVTYVYMAWAENPFKTARAR